ncbi:MAG: aldehyde dehydrogenase family protein [Burkholderiaceae bacterium]|nr:MAG: aldehyde dehydrogenase family protein [Burkholderiaceae bacterium]
MKPDDDTEQAWIDALFDRQRPVALALRESTAEQRRAKLRRLRDALMTERPALVAAFALDLRKPEVEVDLTEILIVVDEIRHALSHLRRWMRPRRVRPTWTTLGTAARVLSQPRGRCLIIGPWNYPLNTLLGPLVSAVAAGNTVILKPSEFTPRVNEVIGRIVGAVFDPSEVALVEGAVATSQRLLALPFDHIFFTGSPEVGKLVMAAAARHLTSVTLELGGKSPVIVDASANLRDAAEQIAWGKLINAGQTCVAPDHVFVHRSVAERFAEAYRAVVVERFGASPQQMAASADLTRMIHERHAARVAGLLDEAVRAGARVLQGGTHDAAARWVAPTLVTDVPADARLAREEIFGPVLPLIAFDTLDEVVARIDASPKPLALYVFSRDASATERLCARTSSGGVGVNLCLQHYSHANLPFGGVNHSGIGRAHGWYGFQAFSHERAFMKAGPWSALKMLFPPYDAGKARLSSWLVRLVARL